MKRKTLLFFALALVLSLCLAFVACVDKNGGINKLTAESGIILDGAFENDSVLKAEHHAADSEQGKAATKMNDYTTEKMIEKLKANRGQGIFIADDETIQKYAETIETDPIFSKILEFVLTEQTFSIAAIQKKFRLGYAKGSYYAEILEALGVISISLPRKVLIQSKDELN